MLGAAGITAVDAGIALTESKYQQAAELFDQAAKYAPPGHPDERGGYFSGQAQALYRQGDHGTSEERRAHADKQLDEMEAAEPHRADQRRCNPT